MNCRQCQGLEQQFDPRTAAKELRAYQKHGPAKTTRILLDAIEAEGVAGATLLDIGGGIGDIQLALLRAGIQSATAVDASSAYLEAARAEGARQGYAERVAYHHGNFVDLAPQLALADIVTLDRVICCYHDMPALVGASAAKAQRLYGAVYPRDTWWVRTAFALMNRVLRISGRSFRIFAHPTHAVDAVVRAAGLEQRMRRVAGVWQIVVYQRVPATDAPG